MKHYYLPALLVGLPQPAAAQLSTLLATPDAPRPAFRGALPNALAAPGGAFRVQGQAPPIRPFLTGQDQLRTVAGAQNLVVLTSYRGYDPNVSSGGNITTLAGLDFGAVPVPRTWLLGVRASL